MLQVLSGVLSGIVGQIAAHFTEKTLSARNDRRVIAAHFIELFDSLDQIVVVSVNLSRLIREHAAGKVVLRTEIARTIEQLLENVERFGKMLTTLESVIKIYDRELLVHFYDSMSVKSCNLRRLDLLTEIVPKAGKGYSIISPTSFPRVKQELQVARLKQTLKSASTGRLDTLWPAHAFDELRHLLLRKFNARRYDLTISADVTIVMASSEADIARLERARDALAAFIKERFPLDRLLG